MDIYRIMYASVARSDISFETSKLLRVSKRNNARANITGFLFYDGDYFAQALEGPRAEVTKIYQRIVADHRHRNIVLVESKPVASRLFEGWSMGLHEGIGQGTRNYLMEVFSLKRPDILDFSADEMQNFLQRVARITLRFKELKRLIAAAG